MDDSSRKKYIISKLEKLDHVNDYINKVKLGTSQDEAFENLMKAIHISGWTESTKEWKHKLLKNWLIYSDIIKSHRGRRT